MTTRTPMGVQDALWLTMDRSNNLMVVDGAMVFTEVPTMEAVREVLERTVARFPVLRRKAVRSGVGWAWQDDPGFDLDDHLSQVSLPGAADMAALQHLLAEIRSVPMDKTRPLWQAMLVAPVHLEDGTTGSALVTRFHHAIADGVRLTQVLLSMCETDDPTLAAVVARNRPKPGKDVAMATPSSPLSPGTAVERVREAVVDVATTATDVVGNASTMVFAAGSAAASMVTRGLSDSVGAVAGAVTGAVADPLGSLAAIPGAVVSVPGRVAEAASGLLRSGAHGVEEGVQVVRHPDRLLDALEVLGVRETRAINDLSSVTKLALTGSESTVWTGKPGSVKAMAWSRPLPLEPVRAVGKQYGCTLNDVLLAAVAGGLRRYQEGRGGHADEIVWMVPVNLKPFEENLPPDLGNYFALVFLPMPLGTVDLKERLTEMHHRMERIKHSDEAVLTFGLQRVVSTSPGQIAYFLTNFFANKSVGVLSNVPGPRSLMTYAGAPVHQVVGFAPCSGDQTMTTTIFTYNGTVTIGFATDAGLVPDPDVLADLVVEELDALTGTLAAPRAKARRRRVVAKDGAKAVGGGDRAAEPAGAPADA